MHKWRKWSFFLILGLILIISFSCNMPGTSNAETNQKEISLLETQSAISVQQTVLAMNEATQNAPTAIPTQAEQPTYTPYPTYTTLPEATNITISTQVVPTDTPSVVLDFDSWMQEEAKILVYEDMKGNFQYKPRVDQALNALGLNSARVVRVADAQGNFLSELNTGRGWDLIITAAETRTGPTGEFWEAIGDLVMNDNVALIAEEWNLDSFYIGKISPLLSRCGITVHKDWVRDPANYNIYDFSVYWLEPEHPVFTEPNVVNSLIVPNIVWWNDAGDLLKLKGGDAQLLAGTQKNEHSSYGVIATCMEGRVIWQSFSTHDYPADDTIALWQNYIVYTLKNRFTYLNQ